MSTEQFDPEKVERTKWVAYDYEGFHPWPLAEAHEIVGDNPDRIQITVPAEDFDALKALRNADRSASIDAQQKLSDALAEVEKELLITQRAFKDFLSTCLAGPDAYERYIRNARAAYDAQEAKRFEVIKGEDNAE